MQTQQQNSTPRLTPAEQIAFGQRVMNVEAAAISAIAAQLGEDFHRAAELVFHCRGNIIVSGIGKAGLIGQKLVATFASTGSRSHFVHPGEAVHGDLGRIHADDLVLMLSQSGETEEIVRLLPWLKQAGVRIIAITAKKTSQLGRAAVAVIELGSLQEACALGLAPSTSTSAMLSIGDALALTVSQMRSFDREDFYRFHPAGNLGRKLAKVEEQMRTLADCRLARCSMSVRQVLTERHLPSRRTGAVMIVDPQGILRGVFTDSDLARLLESRRDGTIDGPIRDVMTKRPSRVIQGSLLSEAIAIMAQRKISELPVVDSDGRPVGLLDITDVVALLPADSKSPPATSPGVDQKNNADSTKTGIVPRPKSVAFGATAQNMPQKSS